MHIFKSALTLGFVLWTIKFTPKGAGFLPVSFSNSSSSDLIWINHSSKPSLVLWLSAGNVPTIPFLQHSMTSLGPEIRNNGAAITGTDRSSKKEIFISHYISFYFLV